MRWHFYPRPPRGGRPGIPFPGSHLRYISIHALREEGDAARPMEWRACEIISIHALREEGDLISAFLPVLEYISIHALREEGDSIFSHGCGKRDYFYPRPPRGGRRLGHRCRIRSIRISIHALREEGDEIMAEIKMSDDISIHALREEGDRGIRLGKIGHTISIHALREEGDIKQVRRSANNGISIHALREEGDFYQPFKSSPTKGFLSTPSARRATKPIQGEFTACFISIHALREEGDLVSGIRYRVQPNFYPRPPRGGRLKTLRSLKQMNNFYPRPPRGGRPFFPVAFRNHSQFLSTPSARRATINCWH